jgi:hypothetical protein
MKLVVRTVAALAAAVVAAETNSAQTMRRVAIPGPPRWAGILPDPA